MRNDFGFIGTGTLTRAVVAAIRSISDAPTIRLSPRSEEISTRLATDYPNVVRESSNADIIAKCGTIFLAIRPQQLDDALRGLSFGPDQTVISFVATVPVEDVRRIAYPATQVCRVTPLPAISHRDGPIVIYPPLPAAIAIFEQLGDLVPAESEDEIMKLGCASATMSSFFQIADVMTEWLASNGVPPSHASTYVRSLLKGLAITGRSLGGTSLALLADDHETRGGLNEHVRQHLEDAGFFKTLQGSLDSVSARLLRKVE